MANGGPFGNPLTTGIALNFEVDMTPYRQMMKDNLQFAQKQAADRKKKEKEFQDLLKNIAYDDSKIHERYRDNARVSYAETIDDLMKLRKNNDLGEMMKRTSELTSQLNYYRQVTDDFNNYSKQDKTKNHVDQQYIDDFNNVSGVDDITLYQSHPNVANLDRDKGGITATPIRRIDDFAFAKKAFDLLPEDVRKDANDNVLRGSYNPQTGSYYFPVEKLADPNAFRSALAQRYIAEQGADGVAHLSTVYGTNPAVDPDTWANPEQAVLNLANKRMQEVLPDYAFQAPGKMIKEKTKKTDFTFGAGGGSTESWTFAPSEGGTVVFEDGVEKNVDNSITFTNKKGGKPTTSITLTKGTLEVDANTGELVESELKTGRSLSKATPVSAVSIGGKRYYKVLNYTNLTPDEENILTMERSQQQLTARQQQKLDKLKADQTFFIPDNETTRNQVWGLLGVPGGTGAYDKIMNQYLPPVGGSQGGASSFNPPS
jgi:hypothetical protein